MTLLTTTILAAAAVNCILILTLVATDLVTAQVVDTVTLQPVLPASGLSACPGQDVTLNCTIVRMTTQQGVLPPTLSWQYRGDTIVLTPNSPPSDSSDYYTAVFHVVGLTTMSTATINNVPLSHHNSMINCLSPVFLLMQSKTITIAGNEVSL